MKIDIYTKSVLTVIAVALLWLCFRESTTVPVRAEVPPPATEVVIAGIKSPDNLLPVKISNIATADHLLPVKISNVGTADHLLHVKIAGVTTSTQTVPVTIYGANANIPVTLSGNSQNPLPVSIESIRRGNGSGQPLPWERIPVQTP